MAALRFPSAGILHEKKKKYPVFAWALTDWVLTGAGDSLLMILEHICTSQLCQEEILFNEICKS